VIKYKKQDYYDKIAEKCAKKLTDKLVWTKIDSIFKSGWAKQNNNIN
jgi:hypothetical protein